MQAVGKKGGVICAAVDPSLVSSEACYSASWALPAHAARESVRDNSASLGPGVTVDLSTGLRTLWLKGEGGDNGEAVLDLTVEVRLRRKYVSGNGLLFTGACDGASRPENIRTCLIHLVRRSKRSYIL